MKTLKYLSGISIALLLTACNTEAPDYQGTWKNTVKDPKLENALVISKNGNNYFITNTITEKETGKSEQKKPMPASVNDKGFLQVNAGAGVVDEKTGNLIGSGSVYKKAK